MIQFYKPSNGEPWEGFGLSTDPKPTDATIKTGTLLFLIDTHQLFVYNSDTQTWEVQ